MLKELMFTFIFVLNTNGQFGGLNPSLLSSFTDLDSLKTDKKDLVIGRGLGPIPDLSKCKRKRNGEFHYLRMMRDFTQAFSPYLQISEDRITGRKPISHFRNKLFGQFIDCEIFVRDILPQTAFGAVDNLKAGDLLGVFSGNTAGLGGITDLLNPDSLLDKAYDPCVNLMQVKERKCKNLQQGVCNFAFNRQANMANVCNLVHLGNVASLAEINCTSKSGMSKTFQNFPLPRVLFNTQLPAGHVFLGFAKLCGAYPRPYYPRPKNPTSKLMGKLNTLKGANPFAGIVPGIGKKKR